MTARRSSVGGIGLMLLRATIEASAVTEFRSLREEEFLPDELPAYRFIRDHLRSQRRMPSADTCRENNIHLPNVTEGIGYYKTRVTERHLFNTLRDGVMGDLAGMVQNRQVNEAVAALRDLTRNVNAVDPSNDILGLADMVDSAVSEYRYAKYNPGLRGITTGWDSVDNATNGLLPGDIAVVVGRPNVGKSYMMLWMLRAAWHAGYAPMLSSMEMSRERLRDRLIAIEAGINPDLIRKGRMDMWAERRFYESLRTFDDMPPVHMLAGKYRKRVSDIGNAMMDSNADIGFVDAGYLLSPDGRAKASAKHELIGDVIEELKAVAEDCKRPIVVTVQFNRSVGKNTKTGELDLSSIAGSDAIGQIASLVLGVRHGEPPNEVTRRLLDVLKNREGPLMNLTTRFQFKPGINMSQLHDEDAYTAELDDAITEDDL